MMKEVVMPKLGLTMVEGVIQRWLKSEGDFVNEGEEILEIETDKYSANVEAPSSGILHKILFHEQGTIVPCSETIAYILEEGEDAVNLKKIEEVKSNKVENNKCAEINRKVSPLAKKFAKENSIDINCVTVGVNGKVELADVISYYESIKNDNKQPKSTPTAKVVAKDLGVDLSTLKKNERITKLDVENSLNSLNIEDIRIDEGDKTIPMVGMRKAISQRMTFSKKNAPHFYLSISSDVTNANSLLSSLKYKASFHDLLIRILAVALTEYPAINVHVYDDKIIFKNKINIGVAVAVKDGLLVPVVKDVKDMNLNKIAEYSSSLIEKVRASKIAPEDCEGNTFTISNLGMFGIDNFSAILNPPESGIMAVGKIKEQPVVKDKQICIRSIVNITVSFDHRAIDGVVGAKFLNRVKELLENPSLLI